MYVLPPVFTISEPPYLQAGRFRNNTFLRLFVCFSKIYRLNQKYLTFVFDWLAKVWRYWYFTSYSWLFRFCPILFLHFCLSTISIVCTLFRVKLTTFIFNWPGKIMTSYYDSTIYFFILTTQRTEFYHYFASNKSLHTRIYFDTQAPWLNA